MKTLIETSVYKKELKSLLKSDARLKNKKKQEFFNNFLELVTAGKPLPREYDNHPAKHSSPKVYQGCEIAHICPDIAVIYRVNKDSVELRRIGKHNNLNLTENFLYN